MPRFYLYAVRYLDVDYEKEIDRILIGSYRSFCEAIFTFKRVAIESGIPEERVRTFMRRRVLYQGSAKKFSECAIYTKNLHGSLGPGGYRLEKKED